MGIKTKTSFDKDKQPANRAPRGKSKKNVVLDALRAKGALGLRSNSSNEKAEAAFFGEIVNVALNVEDSNRGMCLKLLADKGWASIKPSSEKVIFPFTKDAAPHIQAAQVMDAVSQGLIPPDIGNTFVQSIKALIDIEEFTNLKDRIIALEAVLNGDDS